jgi:hypothetical protein
MRAVFLCPPAVTSSSSGSAQSEIALLAPLRQGAKGRRFKRRPFRSLSDADLGLLLGDECEGAAEQPRISQSARSSEGYWGRRCYAAAGRALRSDAPDGAFSNWRSRISPRLVSGAPRVHRSRLIAATTFSFSPACRAGSGARRLEQLRTFPAKRIGTQNTCPILTERPPRDPARPLERSNSRWRPGEQINGRCVAASV